MTPLSSDTILYRLYFRTGNNPYTQDTFFWHKTGKDMRQIVDRCKRYCDNMGLRFVNVRPAILDLDREERLRNQADEPQAVAAENGG